MSRHAAGDFTSSLCFGTFALKFVCLLAAKLAVDSPTPQPYHNKTWAWSQGHNQKHKLRHEKKHDEPNEGILSRKAGHSRISRAAGCGRVFHMSWQHGRRLKPRVLSMVWSTCQELTNAFTIHVLHALFTFVYWTCGCGVRKSKWQAWVPKFAGLILCGGKLLRTRIFGVVATSCCWYGNNKFVSRPGLIRDAGPALRKWNLQYHILSYFIIISEVFFQIQPLNVHVVFTMLWC